MFNYVVINGDNFWMIDDLVLEVIDFLVWKYYNDNIYLE